MHGLSYVFLSFLSGAVPYSVILGKLLLKEDIREYGDGNPGAANVWRAGGPLFGLTAIVLDLLKAFLPVYYAMVYCNFSDNTLMAIAIAPVAGHAFSPFLHFRGGKAVASTYGIWLAIFGVTGGLLVMGATSALFFILQTIDAWSVIMGMVALFVYLFLNDAETCIRLLCLLNLTIVAYKHRKDLKPVLRLRPVFATMIRRSRWI
ncbi:MAG: hypothetical protein GX894_02735 [Clostridia bacterium]|nr:hypothetical protein [Clostridia bacterium]